MKMYALKLLGIRSGVRILQRVEFEKQRAIVSQSSTSYQTPRRQFLKNAAIVGTIWLGGNRGQASAANINSDSRILMAQLSPDDAIIKALQSTLVSRQAVSSFGELAWDHMYKLSSNIPGQVGYMIPSSSTPSYLFMTSPESTHPIRAFVIQTRKTTYQQSELVWFTTDGRMIQVGRAQRENQQSLGVRGAETNAFDAGCFAACAGIAVGLCATPCAICAGVPVPVNPACITCVGCAGGSALFCVVACS